MKNQQKVFEKYPSSNFNDVALLISDHIGAMLAYWDKDLICRFANSAYVSWFGKTKEEMVNNIRIDELLGSLYEKNLPFITAALLGQKQLFERDIPTPDGNGIRHSLTTYIPDINNEAVLGFFVHVADVSYIKDLQKEIVSIKRESLRNIIETEEIEKKYLVDILRESINQRLAGCKIAIESEQEKRPESYLQEDVGLQISDIIKEINLLCQEMIPTEIEMFGIVGALSIYFENLCKQQHKKIDFIVENNTIENIALADKYAIFRILQNFIKVIFDCSNAKSIDISIKYTAPQVQIKLIADAYIQINKRSKEYNAVECRVEYYSGTITELISETQSAFDIEFSLTDH